MIKTRYFRLLGSVFLFILSTVIFCYASGKPEITLHTSQYLDRALSINIQWQSENPVTKVQVTAGNGQKEIVIDEYDNRRNPYGYSGETSVVIPIDPSLFQSSAPYQIQLEDDLRQRSELYSGQAKLPSVSLPMIAASPGMPGAVRDDNWGKDAIRTGKGQGETQDGRSGDMVDKMLKVAERFDTPPSLEPVKVNVMGAENVSFTSRANDDKGLKEISFRVYDATGNKVGEQILNSLGKKWEGSTQPVKISAVAGGNYRVVAQAVDTTGNTSKEQSAIFTMKGTAPPVDGICGTANNKQVSSKPTAHVELCSSPGPASPVNGINPFDWTCTGQNGGVIANCKTLDPPVIVPGVCGTANNKQVSSKPTASAELCASVGPTSPVNGSNPFDWSCAGLNGGATIDCKTLPLDAVCGPQKGQASTIEPKDPGLCTVGTPAITNIRSVAPLDFWAWRCVAPKGGKDVECSAPFSSCSIIVEPYQNATILPNPINTVITADGGKDLSVKITPLQGYYIGDISQDGKGVIRPAVVNEDPATVTFDKCIGDHQLSFTVLGKQGQCGDSHGRSFDSAPTANLCSVGEASPKPSGPGPWKWDCIGNTNGAKASCSGEVNKIELKVKTTGKGTVTSSDNTIKCGNNCSATYNNGTTITLTAIQDPGSIAGRKVKWIGCDSSNENTCTVVMNSKKEISADFIIDGTCVDYQYSLGSAPSNLCLSGEPDPKQLPVSGPWNWNCVGINGGVTRICGPVQELKKKLTVTVQANMGASGKITSISPDSAIDCTTSCSAFYSENTEIKLVAKSIGQSSLEGWLNCTSYETSGNDKICKITMTKDQEIKAYFNKDLGHKGKLQINFNPSSCNVGWKIGGGNQLKGGDIIEVANGNVDIYFLDIDNKWQRPTNMGFNVLADQVNSFPVNCSCNTDTLTCPGGASSARRNINNSCAFDACPQVKGVCGTSNGLPASSTAPTANLCSKGNQTQVKDAGVSWNWDCNGDNGQKDSCSKPKQVNGLCGREIKNQCLVGTYENTKEDISKYYWDCRGNNYGIIASCSIVKPVTCYVTATIKPDLAITRGAKWSIDSGATWRNSGDQPVVTCDQTYNTIFKSVTNCTTPSSTTIRPTPSSNPAYANVVYSCQEPVCTSNIILEHINSISGGTKKCNQKCRADGMKWEDLPCTVSCSSGYKENNGMCEEVIKNVLCGFEKKPACTESVKHPWAVWVDEKSNFKVKRDQRVTLSFQLKNKGAISWTLKPWLRRDDGKILCNFDGSLTTVGPNKTEYATFIFTAPKVPGTYNNIELDLISYLPTLNSNGCSIKTPEPAAGIFAPIGFSLTVE